MKTVRKRPALGEGPRHRSFARSSSSSRASQYSDMDWIRRASQLRLGCRRLDVCHRDRQPQLISLVEGIDQACEDIALIGRHDLLPGIEKSELDEVVVEEGRAVGEAHRAYALDDATDG